MILSKTKYYFGPRGSWRTLALQYYCCCFLVINNSQPYLSCLKQSGKQVSDLHVRYDIKLQLITQNQSPALKMENSTLQPPPLLVLLSHCFPRLWNYGENRSRPKLLIFVFFFSEFSELELGRITFVNIWNKSCSMHGIRWQNIFLLICFLQDVYKLYIFLSRKVLK